MPYFNDVELEAIDPNYRLNPFYQPLEVQMGEIYQLLDQANLNPQVAIPAQVNMAPVVLAPMPAVFHALRPARKESESVHPGCGG